MEDAQDGSAPVDSPHTLWTARLYSVCTNIQEAVKAALNVHAMACGQGDVDAWKASARTSLQSGFHDADPDALIAWEERMDELVRMDMLGKQIRAGKAVSEIKGLFCQKALTPLQREWLETRLATAGLGDRMRFCYYIGKLLGGAEGERYISQCFHVIQGAILEATAGKRHPLQHLPRRAHGASAPQAELGRRLAGQVGGMTEGIKFITTRPGLRQDIHVEHVALQEKTRQELNNRLVPIYTGQRRLARNLLRDVVGRYIGNEPEALEALEEIQRTAALMRFELERGHIDDFAHLLSRHWELSKQLDAGSSNTLIEQIFGAVDDMLEGKMICGAGGGGFLQAIMKRGVTRDMIHRKLKDVFQDTQVGVSNCELI